MRKFGPKTVDHPSIGDPCPACKRPFTAGDFTVLIPLGPGMNPEQRQRAREGRPYNAVAIEVHWACATGEVHETAGDDVLEDMSAAERELEAMGRE